jgi:murein DD-endopeptidase MepM/ murein hydrolase activator NlpD
MRIDEVRARLAAAMAEWYAPREVLIRTDGRVKYVVLSRNRQMAMTALAGGLGLTMLSLAAGWTISDYRLQQRMDEVETAKAAYVELLADVSRYYDEFSTLARSMEANEAALLGLVREGTGDAVDVDAIEAQVARSQLVREEGLAGSAELRSKLQLFETDLRNVVSQNDQLAANIALLQDQLSATEADRQAMQAERERLESDLAQAAEQLAEAGSANDGLSDRIRVLEEQIGLMQVAAESERARGAALRDELADVESELDSVLAREDESRHQLDETRAQLAATREQRDTIAAARDALNTRVAGLEALLDAAVARSDGAELRLTETQRQLEAMRNQRGALVSMRDELLEEVGSLQGQIVAMEQSQQSIVQSLAERTRSGADEVEKTVAMTGIDVDELLRKVTVPLTGLGGPFVPVRHMMGSQAQMVLASVAPLDMEMSRWEKLQVVLRSLPLSAPLDHYTVGSLFGMRKDPINGKLSMHEGLDFSAPMASPVLSTAPGTVVFAGRKGSYGRMVEIDHGFGIHTRYTHLKSILVEVGQAVGYRDKIGLLGTSGRSTGPHVHYEILVDGKPYDPMNFLKAGRYVFKV